MKTVTIAAKPGGTGDIHDIRSEHYDREITFRGATKYAVIRAAYYGGKGYTTHATEQSAIAESLRLQRQDYSHSIIDRDGNAYRAASAWQDTLERV
jgi:hypothetical protein